MMDQLYFIGELTPCSFWFFISTVYFSDAISLNKKMIAPDCPKQKKIMQIKQDISIKKVYWQTLDDILKSQPTKQTQDSFLQDLYIDVSEYLKNALTKQTIDESTQQILNYFDQKAIRQIQQQMQTIKNVMTKKLEQKLLQMVGNLQFSEIQKIYQIILVSIQKQIDDIPNFPAQFQVSKCFIPTPSRKITNLLNMVRTYQPEQEDILKKLAEKRTRTIKPKQSPFNSETELKSESRQIKMLALKPQNPYNQSEAQCQVCSDGNYTEKNKIVFCAGCSISAHQLCIKLNKIPENDWVCELCRYFGLKGLGVMCGICGQNGGLMFQTKMKIKDKSSLHEYNKVFRQFAEQCQPSYKQKPIKLKKKEGQFFTYYNYQETTYTKQLHKVSCQFIWVHFICDWFAHSLKPLSQISKNKRLNELKINWMNFLKVCYICNMENSGYCVKCKQNQCKLYSHPECARKLRLIRKSATGLEIYCANHVPFQLFLDIENKRKKTQSEIIDFCKSTYPRHRQYFFKKYLPHDYLRIQSVLREHNKGNFGEDLGIQKISIISNKAGAITLQIDCQIAPQKVQQPSGNINILKGQIAEIHYKNREPNLIQALKNSEYWRKICRQVDPKMQDSQIDKLLSCFKKNIDYYSEINDRYLIEKYIQQNAKRTIKTLFMHNQNQNQKQGPNRFCICNSNETHQMLQCDICQQWYHFKCIGFTGSEQQAQKMLCYICQKCHRLIKPENYNYLMNQYTALFRNSQ